MFKKIGILLIGVWCVHQMAFANTINESSREQFAKTYACFLEKYSKDDRLIQSLLQPKSEESKMSVDALIQKYGKEKYELSINALVDYYAECQGFFNRHNVRSDIVKNEDRCWLSSMVKDKRVLKPMFLFFLPNVFDEKEVSRLLASYSKEEIIDNALALFNIAQTCDQVQVYSGLKVQTIFQEN